MFVVSITIRVKPNGKAKFVESIGRNATASMRDEPGCRQFDICTSPVRPDEVFLYEIYEDANAFALHKTTPHYIRHVAETEPLVASRDLRMWHLEPAA